MATKKLTPVMNCRFDAPVKIHVLAKRVVKGITENPDVFPDGNVDELDEAATLLGKLINRTKGNTLVKAQRDRQAKIVYDMLNVHVKPFVNRIANGLKSIIELSGFYVSNEPLPHHIPETAVIRRI